eukprot:393483-Amphidinium_carterae.1
MKFDGGAFRAAEMKELAQCSYVLDTLFLLHLPGLKRSLLFFCSANHWFIFCCSFALTVELLEYYPQSFLRLCQTSSG